MSIILIHRISITKASTMATLVPVFTLLFAYLILDEVPGFNQLIGIIPVLLGGYLITRPIKSGKHTTFWSNMK